MAFEPANAVGYRARSWSVCAIPQRFNETFPDMLSLLYQDHGNQANKDGDLLVLQGRCVGWFHCSQWYGRIPVCRILFSRDWQRDFRFTNRLPKCLVPCFDKSKNACQCDNEHHEINSTV